MKDPLCGVDVPACWEEHLTKDQIMELLKIAHRKFYMNPKFIGRQLMGLSNRHEFARLARAGMSIAKLEMLNAKSRTAPV
jgi:hypothetical protein